MPLKTLLELKLCFIYVYTILYGS